MGPLARFRLLSRAGMAAAVIALVAASTLTSVTAAGASPPPAPDGPFSGQSLQTPPGVTPAQTPAPNPSDDLIQGTGKVMVAPTVYNIYWLPAGQHYESAATAASDTNYEHLLDRFFTDVGNSNYYRMVTQYKGSNGTPMNAVGFGGAFLDTTAYPHAGTQADPLLDADLTSQVTSVAAAHSLTQDGNHIFMVYTAFNIFECQTPTSDCNFFKAGHTNAYCAYHNSFNSGSDIYAFMGDDSMFGDPGGCSVGVAPNGDAAADAEISTGAHEFIESVTDPNIDNWLSSVGTGQQEIGDLCNRNDGPHNSVGADVDLNGHQYDVQQMWSNAVNGCAMDLNVAKTSDVPPVLDITKTADATAVTGQTINYSIPVRNPSNTDAATLVTVSDTLPAGVTYVSGSSTPAPSNISGQTLTWGLSTIAIKDTSTITFQATVGTPATYTNCASVTYDDMLQIGPHSGSVASCPGTVVSNADTSVIITSSANPSVYGQSVTLTATVSVTSPGSGTPTGNVVFKDGATTLATVALNGGSPDKATFSTASFSVATHAITAQYLGGTGYNASAVANFSQVVNKAPTTTTVLTSGSPSDFGSSVTFTATVTPASPSTSPASLPSGTFTFLVDGTSYATVPVTQSTGKGHFSISTLLPGMHVIEADYNGDGNFLTSSGQTVQIVTCTNNITGNVPGTVVVGAGTTCINGATIGGGILANGATIFITNSTTGGSVQLFGSHLGAVCSSNVHGSVIVKNSTGFVVIGDPGDDGCGGNTVIGGGVVLTTNHGDIEVGSNHLPSLTLSGTTGVGPFADDTRAEIESNNVVGSVSCSGNVPAPSNDGTTNTIGGGRTGQCSTI
jgi:uncharacterized repeat protein (TIGR01451 family)